MKSIVKRCAVLAVLGAVSISTGALAQSQTDHLSESQAVGLIRVVNTTEADIFLRTHQYAPMDALLDHKFMRGLGVQAGRPDLTSATYKDYNLHVTLSPDYMHYVTALIPVQASGPTANGACATAVFSNEHGIIYTGRALGCEDAGNGTAGNRSPLR